MTVGNTSVRKERNTALTVGNTNSAHKEYISVQKRHKAASLETGKQVRETGKQVKETG